MGDDPLTYHDDAEPPRLSVVMAVHDVAEYLPEALGSVLDQSFRDLEVVVVDDGSTDDSASVVTRFAEADRRVHLVTQENAGLGAARNAGVAHARGRFLTFADGDDVVPPAAYEAMMDSLEHTGSDLAVGTLERLGGRRKRVGRLMRDNHHRRREGVTLADMPQILADVFAVNKIFRRELWDTTGLQFPVGTRYEDQPTMTAAFLQAARFDVLPQTVYLWRRRHDGSSITQTRHLIDDLRDRMATKRASTEAVLAAHPELHDLWYSTILPIDLWAYFEAAVDASDDYWALLRDTTREFWNPSTVRFVDTVLPIHQRLMGALVIRDRREDLAQVVRSLAARSRHVPLEIGGDEVLFRVESLGLDPDRTPPGCRKLRRHEMAWEARVLGASWSQGRLTLNGFAAVENLATNGRSTSLTARLAGHDGEDEPLEVRSTHEPSATRRMGRPGQNFDDCGFELDIDLDRLAREHPPVDGVATWRLRFAREVDGLRRRGGVTGFRGNAVERGWQPARGGVQARLRDAQGSLVLDLRALPSGATWRSDPPSPDEVVLRAAQLEYADSQRSSSA